MQVKYITIEREYGSGGTKIARLLSERTGIPCYGKEILESVSRRLNVSVDDLETYEENMTGSFLYTFYMMAKANDGDSNMLSKEGQIFIEEQEEIQNIAKNGSAVFVGHCASEALKEEKGVLKVFIHCSDDKEKENRIIEEYGIKKPEVEKIRKQFDKKRANYYYANTTRKWNDYKNYDIVLNSAALGIEGCVSILESLFPSRE